MITSREKQGQVCLCVAPCDGFSRQAGRRTAETVTDKFEPFVRTCGGIANQPKNRQTHFSFNIPASDLCAGIKRVAVNSLPAEPQRTAMPTAGAQTASSQQRSSVVWSVPVLAGIYNFLQNFIVFPFSQT